MNSFNMDDYQEVPDRVKEFYEKCPEGAIVPRPHQIVGTKEREYVLVYTDLYKDQEARDKNRPDASGQAWQPVPGRGPYKNYSEVQNAETASIGRAIFNSGVVNSPKVASKEEVEYAQAENVQHPYSEADAIQDLDTVVTADQALQVYYRARSLGAGEKVLKLISKKGNELRQSEPDKKPEVIDAEIVEEK